MQSKHAPILCCLDNKKKTSIIPGPQPINPSTLMICQSILKKKHTIAYGLSMLGFVPQTQSTLVAFSGMDLW